MVGFDARNKDTIHQLYICPSCSFIFREPVQLFCSHRQCKTCAESIEGETIVCSECQEETLKNTIMCDRGFKNDMKSLSIMCSLCEWNGLFKDYEEHLQGIHPNAIREQNNLTNNLVECKRKQNASINISCTNNEAAYLYSVSCTDTLDNQSVDTYGNVTSTPIDHSRRQTTLETEINMGRTVPSSIVTTTNENINIQVSDITNITGAIQALNDNIQRLNNAFIRLQNLINSLTRDAASVQLSVQEQNTVLNFILTNQEILLQDLASLQQQIDDMRYASYDGTLIWKITNVREKMMDAQSERQASIYSPPFYSSKDGYKMRVRLYLNGDENARRTHMSLLFVLMRGSYDAILKFPFNYKVTFCLYDQTPQQRHIIDSFRPDIRSDSFQRPRLAMNIANGIPKFFPLAMIQQDGNPYIRDDTMFIKVMVDFSDMPRTLLPYVSSLNPGLPEHVRQTMIQAELERLMQQQSQQTSTQSLDNNDVHIE